MAEYSILVVEDEPTLRRLLEYRLSKLYHVQTAENGVDALHRLEEEIPDLIISDIMMPKMDGFRLQAELQERKDTRAIPFIFLTAKADEHSRLKGMRLGVDDYITKPFDIEQLLSRIDRLLERTQIFRTQLDAKLGMDFSKKLMPKKLPEVPGYFVDYYNMPLDHGGGDLFDWAEARPGVYIFTVGDVMGKGLQAKFYAFSFLSYVRGTLHAMLRTTHSPAELMRRVNHVLMQDEIMEDTFASLLLMRWEPAQHRITYCNAGHCRPILLTPNGPEIVGYSDIILGLDAESDFRDTRIDIPPDSALVAYTDGLTEQRMQSGDQLGEKRLMSLAADVLNAPNPIPDLLRTILMNSEEDAFTDDILVFWLRRVAGR